MAQNNNSPFIGMQYHYGYVWAHTVKMNHLVLDHLQGVEVNAGMAMNGDKLWHQWYHYPELGGCFTVLNLANDERLGTVYGLYPYLNFPMAKNKVWNMFIRAGAGLGYVTKYYDRTKNFKNISIGTPFNAFINFRLENRFYLSRELAFCANIGLTHFSNGAFTMPNLGINIPSICAGLLWFPKGRNSPIARKDTLLLLKKIEFATSFSAGIKESMPVGRPKAAYFSSNTEALYRLNKTQRLGLGFDICYDASYLNGLKEKGLITSDIQNTQIGLGFIHDLTMSKFSYLFEMGYYVYTVYNADSYFYHRIALRYQLNRHLYFSLCLKTHFARANNIDAGLGWRF